MEKCRHLLILTPTVMLMLESPLNLVQVMFGSLSSAALEYNRKHSNIDTARFHNDHG